MALYKSRIPNPPSFVEYGTMRFLIFDAPNDENLHYYIEVFKSYGVAAVVRVCEATYSIEILENHGFQVYDFPFPDGDAPPKYVINNWLNVCKKFRNFNSKNNSVIAVHCVAGLGRAPVLVAISLIEAGMDPIEAVQLIRSKRKGAINRNQLQFLKKYNKGGCIIA